MVVDGRAVDWGRCPERAGRDMGRALEALWQSLRTTWLVVMGKACTLQMDMGPGLDTWSTTQELLDLEQVGWANGRSGEG